MLKNFIRVPYVSTVHDQNEIDAVVNALKTSTQMVIIQKNLNKKLPVFMDTNMALQLIQVHHPSTCLWNALIYLRAQKLLHLLLPSLLQLDLFYKKIYE